MLARPGDQAGRIDGLAGTHHDESLDALSAVGVASADDAGLQHRRMAVEQRFYLGWPHLVARGIDHALEPVDHEEIAFLVDIAQVASAEVAHAPDFGEGLRRGLGLAPVAAEHLRAVDQDFADTAGGQFLQGLRIDHDGRGVLDRQAQALLLGALARIDMRRRDGFGQAIALDVLQSPQRRDALGHRLGHGRAAAVERRQGAEVISIQIRLVEKVDQHGRNRRPRSDAMALDHLRGAAPVPARHDDHGSAQVDRQIHPVLQAGDMKHRQRGQGDAILRIAPILRRRHDGMHHAGMGVHATLRRAGGARGIGNHRQVLRTGPMRLRQPLQPERLAPRQRRPRQRQRRGGNDLRQRQIDGLDHVVGISANDGPLQRPAEQRLHIGQQFLSGDGDLRPAVADDMPQLLG